tara:strand:- start:425 stop:1078 length:654 start_codon:yes stop_codon:yes gene_type:complete
MSNLILAQSEALTMSSREIAEFTGKRHDHVMRDIKKMLLELYPAGAPNFGGTYLSDQNKELPLFNLDRKHTDCLLTGYSTIARMKVIDRWHELESKRAPKLPETFAEALQLAADQAKQLELAAPKVAFVDKLVDRSNLLTATQIGQKHKLSGVKLNRLLDELGVYNGSVKRVRVFQQWFIDKGFGEMKKTEQGFDQALFTNAGEVWINEKLISEGCL